MGAITKIWLFSLKPGVSITDGAFRDVWRDILRLISGYSSQESHVLLQNTADASKLAFISGYPSLELNQQADAEYAQKYMKPMFELVQHDDIMMLDAAVESLPQDDVLISLHASAVGTGGWDTMAHDAPRWVQLQRAGADAGRFKRVPDIWRW